ncbi:MAG: DMT family transporter [Acidobacteria bacterium]|nr:DMT family transporter [Acidobacteriota bacterium]
MHDSQAGGGPGRRVRFRDPVRGPGQASRRPAARPRRGAAAREHDHGVPRRRGVLLIRARLAALRWETALVGISLVWGSTFVLVQDAVDRVPPSQFLAIRFALATIAMAAAGGLRGLGREDLRAGIPIGVALFAGYALQTVALRHTTASNTGFITGLFVVFTPLIGATVTRRLPSAATAGGVALATAGLALLATPSGIHLGAGDALALGCAVAFAAHIVLLGHLGAGRPAIRITTVQIAAAAAASGVWNMAKGQAVPSIPAPVWGAALLTGVLASAVAFFVQTSAQRVVPPTRAAVILTAEPVFAAVFGYLFAGDRLSARGYGGAALILAGILVAELLAPAREEV